MLDAQLKDRPYLLGAEFSAADILMGQVLNFVVDATLFDGAPTVKAFHTRLKNRPGYVRAATVQALGPKTAAAAR